MNRKKKPTEEVKMSTWEVFRRLVRDARPIYGWLLLGALLGGIVVACTVIAPKLLGQGVQLLYDAWAGERPKAGLTEALLPICGALAGVYLLKSIVDTGKMVLMNNVVSKYYTCTLRIKLSDKLSRLPISFIDKTPAGQIIDRIQEDVSNMGGSIHNIVDVTVMGFMQIVVIAVMMLRENWRMGLAVLLLMPLSIVISSRISAACGTYFRRMFEESGKMYSIVEESYASYQTTKAYNYEETTIAAHAAANKRQKDAEAKAIFLQGLITPCITAANALAYILVALIGGYLTVQGALGVGAVVTVLLYSRQFSAPLEQIAEVLGSIQRICAAARRVYEMQDAPEEEPIEGHLPEEIKGDVDFENVNFSYDPETPLIRDFTVKVKHGQKVAIVGPTGIRTMLIHLEKLGKSFGEKVVLHDVTASVEREDRIGIVGQNGAGKTTLVNLLMRFYDIQSGKITIDGHDIAAVSREDVRGLFGMVLQDTWLFGGTVADNVAYGKPEATREEIVTACDEAYCDHFIRTLPQGYDTVVSEDSINISGGQKQLLTIARALLANRRLLILDEATSNVDTRTEILLQKAMDKLMRGRTCFVIAHRLSTIVDADLILVINDGQIVEAGTHEGLLEKQGFYYRLYTSQYAV